MSGTDEQLISFFAYSMFIYPVTNYLASPKRKYPRYLGAIYAMMFLFLVSGLHMVYENREKGPNHYQLLNCQRDASTSVLKKAYKRLSLELHPDKNKSPDAPAQFNKVKHAYDVLSNTETRGLYNRLGEEGVKHNAQAVVDLKYIVIQLIVYYVSSVIFAFLMTMSEPSGDAFSFSVFGLSVMLFLEGMIVIEEVPLPTWLFPYHTPQDIISALRRLFPAYMNGCRCISGSYFEDPIVTRAAIIQEISTTNRTLSQKAYSMMMLTVNYHKRKLTSDEPSVHDENSNGEKPEDQHNHPVKSGQKQNIFSQAIDRVTASASLLREDKENKKLIEDLEMKAKLVWDPVALAKYVKHTNGGSRFTWIRNLVIYIVLWLAVAYFRNMKNDSGKKA